MAGRAKIRTTVDFSPALFERLSEAASRLQRPRSQIIEEAVQAYLAQLGIEVQRPQDQEGAITLPPGAPCYLCGRLLSEEPGPECQEGRSLQEMWERDWTRRIGPIDAFWRFGATPFHRRETAEEYQRHLLKAAFGVTRLPGNRGIAVRPVVGGGWATVATPVPPFLARRLRDPKAFSEDRETEEE